MSRWLLRGGRIIDPVRQIDAIGDLVLQDGKIAPRAAFNTSVDGGVIDCTGWWVAPGFIDPHVHLRDPGFPEKETIFTGLRAAAAGGFTAVAAMANTAPVNDTPEVTRYMLERARAAGGPRLIPVSAVTKGLAGCELVAMESMVEAGARLFSDDGMPIDDPEVLARALRAAAAVGMAVALHEEDRVLTDGGAMNAGAVADEIGVSGIPSSAESARVRRDLAIAMNAGAPVHIAHISTAESVDLVRAARRIGLKVTCEVTPHHFTLDDEAVSTFGPDARMSPPLRSRTDRETLRVAIADGTIDMFATDHAPHEPHSKKMAQLGPLFNGERRAARLSSGCAHALAAAANGIVGLETAVGLALALVHQGMISPSRMVAMMSVQPARLLRLKEVGTLAEGGRADVTVIDPNRPWTVDPASFFSRSRNMPFAKMKLRGKALLTIVEGTIVYDARGEKEV